MNTQIMFKVDKKLKDSAMRKAEAEGVTISDMLKFSMKAFVDDEFKIGLIYGEKLKKNIEEKLEDIDNDLKSKKNLSPTFKDAKSAVNYLKKISNKACG